MRVPGSVFEGFVGAPDPAVSNRIAHDTAAALLSRVRGASVRDAHGEASPAHRRGDLAAAGEHGAGVHHDVRFAAGEDADAAAVAAANARAAADARAAVVARMVAYTDEHGIDDIVELWSRAAPHSLPGALWRLYAVRAASRADSVETARLFERGAVTGGTVGHAIAGAPRPASPDDLQRLVDDILRGAFVGDFELALDRAAAFCRVLSRGAIDASADAEGHDAALAGELTRKSARFLEYAGDLRICARMWADGRLE